jgi:hypothetical protein
MSAMRVFPSKPSLELPGIGKNHGPSWNEESVVNIVLAGAMRNS